MEIGGVSLPSFAPAATPEPRAAKSVPRETGGVASNTIGGGSRDNPPDRAALARSEAARAALDAQRENPREVEAANASAAATGHIKFEYEDKTRVMQLYDSKDVLIYQVPPKGVLQLVRDQRETTANQVETSA